ncbi:MAG TPA: hypothetical protein VGH82_08890 [Gaiellaceae bacterium]
MSDTTDLVSDTRQGHALACGFDKPGNCVQGEQAMTTAARTRVSTSPLLGALIILVVILILPF